MKSLLVCSVTTCLFFSGQFIAYAVQAKIKDPTKPKSFIDEELADFANVNAGVKKGLELQSIMLINNQYKAVISGQIVQAGDKIKQYKITKIDSGKVYLYRDEKQQTLELYRDAIKK